MVLQSTPVQVCAVGSPDRRLSAFIGGYERKAAPTMKPKRADVARYAQMLSALGTEPRLRIMRLLLSAHPGGMIVGDIQAELGIPASTLSHHLEKIKNVSLASVEREHCCLRYSANTEILQELLAFLFAECCSHSRAVQAEKILPACR